MSGTPSNRIDTARLRAEPSDVRKLLLQAADSDVIRAEKERVGEPERGLINGVVDHSHALSPARSHGQHDAAPGPLQDAVRDCPAWISEIRQGDSK